MKENTYLSRYDALYWRMVRRLARAKGKRTKEIDHKGAGRAAMIYGKRAKYAPGSEAARVHNLGIDF